MSSQVFVNGVTLTDASWFNDVDAVTYDGTTSQILVGGGTGTIASWTAATGTGSPMRGTSPSITTSIISASTTLAVFNTVATTVNAFGGASVALNVGHASGTNTILGASTFSQAGTFSSTLGVTGALTATAGIILPSTSANITLGSNYISNGGTDAGFSLDASNNATFSAGVTGQAGSFTALSASASIAVASGQRIYLDGVAASGDTYLYEASANEARMIVGGSLRWLGDATSSVLYAGGVGVATATSTGLSVTGTLAASGNTTVGNGTTSPIFAIDGDGAANAGAVFKLLKDSVQTGIISHRSWLLAGGSTASDMAYFAETGLGHYFYTNGSTTPNVTIASGGAVTMAQTLGVTGGIYPGATQTAAALVSQASSGAGTTTTYIGNQAITTSSDERIKTNVRLWNGDASEILRALPVKAWDTYTQDAPIGGYEGGYVGFTAQDMHKVAPWSVNTQGDTGLPWQARYEFLNGIIVKGWQDHESKIVAQQVELQEQSLQIATLLARVSTLESK